MDNHNEDRKKPKRKARERLAKRKERRESLGHILPDAIPTAPNIQVPDFLKQFWLIVQDNLWQMREQGLLANLAKIGAALLLIILGFWVLGILFSPNIGPSIQILGMDLGGKSVDEATEMLFNYWNDDLLISVSLDGQNLAQVHPSEIGLRFDAAATALAAKNAGLSGFPFGLELEPVLSSDYGEAQSYMLALGSDVFVPSFEAGYEWRDGTLVSVQGRSSRELDIALSVQRIVDNPLLVVKSGRLELVTNSTAPLVVEADPYYNQALEFVSSDFVIEGYDPFADETQFWRTTKEQMAGWLQVTDNGLVIREDGLESFISYINNNVLNTSEQARYLDPQETYTAIDAAFRAGESAATLRIRHAGSTYVLENGDWGYRLSRRTGLPFNNISLANPGVDWNATVAGQRINLPSRDLVLPLDPVPEKRIVVDLDRYWLVAFENGEVVFNWPISVGRTDAPTYPGIYQILQKVDVAYGSGFSLCNESNECGQWEMSYFMGIYEVSEGLTNGFHGSVSLPNGARIDGGSQQLASTYGCVMSDDLQAAQLYNWADVGVVVEIVSSEFPPQSDTARAAMDFITTVSRQS